MSFATPTQLTQRCDVRMLGDLVGDDGVRVGLPELLTNANLQAALDDASGEMLAALLQGKRYSSADLATLTGDSQKYLVRLNCEIALGLLWERRGYYEDDRREEAMARSRKALERLRRGETVFDVEGVKDAGLPSVSTPSRVTLENLNLTVDEARRGFYPARRLPGE